MSNPVLALVRGVPGSGKTTYAKALAAEKGFRHFETDQWFTDAKGNYNFDGSKLAHFHAVTLQQTKMALEAGESVVVANTFVKLEHLEQYMALGFPTKIVECSGNFKDVHNVPQNVLDDMRKNWERIPGAWRIDYDVVP